jgi:hypothetical protein
MGVALLDALVKSGRVALKDDVLRVTRQGETFFGEQGIDLQTLSRERRALCKTCLDWSQRRFHLAGELGAALLNNFIAAGWARRERSGRTVRFSPDGETRFRKLFSLA